jgi:glucokinase
MKRAIFVNGVPASGKSTVAHSLSAALVWPLLTLDTIKEPFFDHLGTGDRDYNRSLGKASYQAIFSLVADWPENSGVVIDAWFGFQPMEVLQKHIARAGLSKIVEVWCHAEPEMIGARYLARATARSSGHLGPDYVPELISLASRARPTGLFPVVDVDTGQTVHQTELLETLRLLL